LKEDGVDINAVFADMVKRNGSDLFLSVGATPFMKVEGQMLPCGTTVLNAATIRQVLYGLLNESQKKTFEDTHELNVALKIPNIGRFRLNLFLQQGEPSMVARHVKSVVPTMEELGLPPVLRKLALEERGLVLVVGATGTGKSTSLAAMIDYRNTNKPGHILSIEDPIEFIHVHKKSLVNQREVGIDTESYEVALSNALREAPDVILIGEVRDMSTMKHALTFAETGHLCFTTLHASTANQAVERVMGFFPDSAHKQLLLEMSMHIKAVVSQRLAKGVNGKRVPVVEVMMMTPFIADLIAQGRLSEIKEAMQKDTTSGSQTYDDELFKLVHAGRITQDEALQLADSRTNLALKFKLNPAAAKSTAEFPSFNSISKSP
jgi:twitching motility protein PilU